MLGVDLVDQLIVYYQPKNICWQIWMSLLLHSADIIWMNLYFLYKEKACLHPAMNNDAINVHKQFSIEFIKSLILCAKKEDTKHSATR